ncbi:hypothetical protein IG197_31855 (plasmid) [Aminobacter sp. SR38]|jgi:outer membrane lipoprotein-sorting protein|uniref:hypothetical protein n=1 Tax=Aminobacter sp. SR38 TaxID=2774562 RepID=UPI0017824F3C|nr:hypothetical protein [Aminobacter sp. SR38]QOF75184.1 hypothetical protein IG197_31855 [Aminobacter sp. SR38]
MKIFAIAAAALLVVSGCTTSDTTTTSAVQSSNAAHDLAAVCLTDTGKAVSEGTTYKGKTCSKPDTSMVYPKPNLVWR